MRLNLLKHKKWIVIPLCGVLILSITAGIAFQQEEEDNEDIIWREYPVGRGDIIASLDGVGKLEFAGAFHGFDVELKIEEILVEVGQEVKKGDILVQYSKEEIEKKIEELKDNLASAKRTLEDQQNALQSGKLQNELANTQSQQAAQNAYESAKRELDASIRKLEQKVKELQETISSLQEELKQAEEGNKEETTPSETEPPTEETAPSETEPAAEETTPSETQEEESTEKSQTTAKETTPSETQPQEEDSAANSQTTAEGAMLFVTEAQEEDGAADSQTTVGVVLLSVTETQEEDSTAAGQTEGEEISQPQTRIDTASAAEDQIESLKAQISQAQSELEAAEKQLDAQYTALDNLEDDYERQTAQNKENQGIQDKINSLGNAGLSNAIKNAQTEVDKAKAAFQAAEDLLNTPVLTAKADGIVTQISYMPGEDVPAGKSIITIGESSNQQVIVEIPQEDIGSIEVGQLAEMRFPANPDEALAGNVQKKSLLPTDGTSGVTYQVTVAFDENHPELLTGMTCNVKFILKKVENVLTLANKAITLRDGKQVVTVKLPDGSHEEREIKTGFSDGRISEITSGLSEGDTVVVAG